MATGQDGTDGASPPGESESAVAAAAVRYDMATCSTLIPTVKSHSGHDATDDAPPEHGAEEDEGGASDDDDDDDEAEPEANEGGEGSDGGQPSRPKKHIAVTREERRILSRYLPAFENKGLLDTFFRELNKLSREEYDAVTTFTKAELAYVQLLLLCSRGTCGCAHSSSHSIACGVPGVTSNKPSDMNATSRKPSHTNSRKTSQTISHECHFTPASSVATTCLYSLRTKLLFTGVRSHCVFASGKRTKTATPTLRRLWTMGLWTMRNLKSC